MLSDDSMQVQGEGGSGVPNGTPFSAKFYLLVLAVHEQFCSTFVDGSNRRRNTYSDELKKSVYAMLLERTSVGKLKHGVTRAVSHITGVPLRVVQRIWDDGRKGGGVNGVCSKKPQKNGHKKKAFDPEAIKTVPLRKRTTLKDLANALGMSKATLHRRFKDGEFRRHTNAIKFTLTEENKKARVRFCLSMLNPSSVPHEPRFNGMYNIVYIDEKWFYRTKQTQTYYMAPDENDPERTT